LNGAVLERMTRYSVGGGSVQLETFSVACDNVVEI